MSIDDLAARIALSLAMIHRAKEALLTVLVLVDEAKTTTAALLRGSVAPEAPVPLQGYGEVIGAVGEVHARLQSVEDVLHD